jgi:hypothetical protein
MHVLTNMINSYNESSRVKFVLQIFNVISFMFIAKHSALYMHFLIGHVHLKTVNFDRNM